MKIIDRGQRCDSIWQPGDILVYNDATDQRKSYGLIMKNESESNMRKPYSLVALNTTDHQDLGSNNIEALGQFNYKSLGGLIYDLESSFDHVEKAFNPILEVNGNESN